MKEGEMMITLGPFLFYIQKSISIMIIIIWDFHDQPDLEKYLMQLKKKKTIGLFFEIYQNNKSLEYGLVN